mmetsp:Transcript_16580/g.29845  ORF Transcript_16580/g.29845 Transcript_16580/m.29845 type:complete len:183 (+) Transcript_16580:1615-2163(+)
MSRYLNQEESPRDSYRFNDDSFRFHAAGNSDNDPKRQSSDSLNSSLSKRSTLKFSRTKKKSVVYPEHSSPSPVLATLAAEVKKMFEALPQIAVATLSKSMERRSEPKRKPFKVKKKEERLSSMSFSRAYRDFRPRRALPRKETKAVTELATAQKYFEEFHFKSRLLLKSLEASVLRGPNVSL